MFQDGSYELATDLTLGNGRSPYQQPLGRLDVQNDKLPSRGVVRDDILHFLRTASADRYNEGRPANWFANACEHASQTRVSDAHGTCGNKVQAINYSHPIERPKLQWGSIRFLRNDFSHV